MGNISRRDFLAIAAVFGVEAAWARSFAAPSFEAQLLTGWVGWPKHTSRLPGFRDAAFSVSR